MKEKLTGEELALAVVEAMSDSFDTGYEWCESQFKKIDLWVVRAFLLSALRLFCLTIMAPLVIGMVIYNTFEEEFEEDKTKEGGALVELTPKKE